jgi:hypothetical protein
MSTNFPVNRRTSSNVLGTPPDARPHVDALGKNGAPSLRAPHGGFAAPTSAQKQAAMRPMGEAFQGPSAMETRLAQVSDGQPVYADRPHYAHTVADGAVASELRLEQAGLKLGGGEANLLSGHGGKSVYVQTGSGELYRLKLRDQGGIDVTGMVTGKRGQDAPLTPTDWQQAKRWLSTQTQTQEQTQPQTPEQRRASAAAPLLVRRVEEALRAGGMDGMSYPQGSFTMSVPRSVVRPASDPIDPLHQARDQLGLGYVSGKSDHLRIPNDARGGAFIARAYQSSAFDEIGNTLGGSKGTQLDEVAKLFASKGASAEFMKGLRATQGQGRIAGVFGIAEGFMGMVAMGKGVRVLKARAQRRYPVQQLPFSRDRSVEKIVKEHLHNAASAAGAVAKQTPNTVPTALPVTPPTTSTPTPPPIRGRARHHGKLYQPGVTKAARAVAAGKAGSRSGADPRVTGNGVNGTHTQQPMQPAAPHVQHADQAQHTQHTLHAQQHQRSEGTKRLSAQLKAMLIDCESPRTISMGAGRERKSFVVGVNARNGQRFQIEINPNGSLNRHSVSLSAGTHFASNEPNEGNRESDIARTQSDDNSLHSARAPNKTPRSAGPNTGPVPRAPAPEQVTLNPNNNLFEATWPNEIVPRVSFTPLQKDGTVVVDALYRKAQVSGYPDLSASTGGQMLADSLKAAGITKPQKIRIFPIAKTQPTFAALQRGEDASKTVLGNTLKNTVRELSGKVANWRWGVDGPSYDRQTWIEVDIIYPANSAGNQQHKTTSTSDATTPTQNANASELAQQTSITPPSRRLRASSSAYQEVVAIPPPPGDSLPEIPKPTRLIKDGEGRMSYVYEHPENANLVVKVIQHGEQDPTRALRVLSNELNTLNWLLQAGFPVIKPVGLVRIGKNYGLLLPRINDAIFSKGYTSRQKDQLRSVAHDHGPEMIKQLEAIRAKSMELGVHGMDFQFIIETNGKISIFDPMIVTPEPNAASIQNREIDSWINKIRGQLSRNVPLNKGDNISATSKAVGRGNEATSDQKLLPGGHEAIRLADGHKVFIYEWNEKHSWPSTVQDAAENAGLMAADGPLVFVPKVRDPSGQRPQNELTPEIRTWASVSVTKLYDPQMMAMINESPTLLKLLQLALSENTQIIAQGSGIAHHNPDKHSINLGRTANGSPAEMLDVLAHELTHATVDSFKSNPTETLHAFLQDRYKQEARAMFNQIRVYTELRAAYDQKRSFGDSSEVEPSLPALERQTSPSVSQPLRGIRERYAANGNEEQAIQDLEKFAANPKISWTAQYSSGYLEALFKPNTQSIETLKKNMRAQPAVSAQMAKNWISAANFDQVKAFIQFLEQTPDLKRFLKPAGIYMDMDNRIVDLLTQNLGETNNKSAQSSLIRNSVATVTSPMSKLPKLMEILRQHKL